LSLFLALKTRPKDPSPIISYNSKSLKKTGFPSKINPKEGSELFFLRSNFDKSIPVYSPSKLVFGVLNSSLSLSFFVTSSFYFYFNYLSN